MEPNREIELKLEASSDDLRRLQRHPLVRGLSQGRAVTRQLETVYFDTPEADLAAAGFALRIRHQGARRVQALKGERSSAAGLFERVELEVAVEADGPDLEAIPDAALRTRVRQLVGAKPLEEVFRTRFRRSSRRLRDGDAEWTLDVDEGEIVAGERRDPICEVELELRAGEPARLFEFALALQDHFELRPGTRSKAERGYALARGEPIRAHRSRRIALDPGARTEDVLGVVVSQCLEQITRNAPCAAAGADIEGVHQMRIGVRRLRTALAAFGPMLPAEPVRTFRSELHWLGRELGAARDVDVFTNEVLGPLESELEHDVGFKRLREEAAALRAECTQRVREVLGSSRYARLVLELGGWIASRGWRNQPLDEDSARLFEPARDAARERLERRHRKVLRRGARLAESEQQRHRLRLQLKALRYTGEFFRELFPDGGSKRQLRRIARLQRALGRLNDLATAERVLARLLVRLGAERGPVHDRAAGFIEGWTARLAVRELEATGELWRRVERSRSFWH